MNISGGYFGRGGGGRRGRTEGWRDVGGRRGLEWDSTGWNGVALDGKLVRWSVGCFAYRGGEMAAA